MKLFFLLSLAVETSCGRAAMSTAMSTDGSPPNDLSLQPWVHKQLKLAQEAAELLKKKFAGQQSHSADVQPAFAGTWQTARYENIDEFLNRAMGVGYMKRKVAAKATQKQCLYQQGNVIHLEITDARGKMRYALFPDGRVVAAKGFMRLPIMQKSRWGPDGSLHTEERYNQCLGDQDPNPIVKSTRSVTKSGEMLVKVERTLLCGEVVSMRTWYRRLPEKNSRLACALS